MKKLKEKFIRWGIYGPGAIAAKFAEAVTAIDGTEIRAVAGRTQEKAAAFAERHAVLYVESSLLALVARDDIDAVYVATTHNVHCDATCICLEAGKAVLCEKPLAMNAVEVEQMIALARRKSVFLMEALWTRFLPAWQRVRELIADDAIGAPRLITGSFGFVGTPDPKGRLLNKALAGGSLLDLGVYPVSIAQMLCPGAIDGVCAQAEIGSMGVDTQTALVVRFAKNRIALLSAVIGARTENSLIIAGESGQIKVCSPFWAATKIKWTQDGRIWHSEAYPHRCNGFTYQIDAVHGCLRAGQIESPVMPHEDSLKVAQIMDAAREKIGLRYAADDFPREPVSE